MGQKHFGRDWQSKYRDNKENISQRLSVIATASYEPSRSQGGNEDEEEENK